ncbi:MAG TPA: MoaD/ThiS family protein [Casimicrobiaceae bacterium]|nr:MoaD/ThiS family protein [Casimicrobiaceae bacterium]
MEITLKLFATLGDYLPHELNGRVRVHNELPLDVADGTTVQAVIDQMHLPRKMTHLVLVNGVYIPPQGRATHPLRSGDALAVWPPIAGG